MTVETINATLFPVFLFIVFFSTACCFFYSLSHTETNRSIPVSTTSSNSEPSTLVNTPSNTNNKSSYPSSLQIETPEPLIQKQPEVEPLQLISKEVAFAPTPITTAEFSSVTINTQLITLRQARAIAGTIKKINPSLGIQQKVNGSDASVEWLRVQIKNRLEQAPEVVTPIILELAPTASGVQPQSTRKPNNNRVSTKTTTSRYLQTF